MRSRVSVAIEERRTTRNGAASLNDDRRDIPSEVWPPGDLAIDDAWAAPYASALRALGLALAGPGGGIGRRAGFRCQWLNGREGSSPFLGTTRMFADVRR